MYKELIKLKKKNEEYVLGYVIPFKQHSLIPLERYNKLNQDWKDRLNFELGKQSEYIRILEERSNHLESILNNKIFKVYKKARNLISLWKKTNE